MTTSISPILENHHAVGEQNQNLGESNCKLYWRQGQLLVKKDGLLKQPNMSSLEKKESLAECLSHSTVNLVRVDPNLGEDGLLLWVEACEIASKAIFLRIPSNKQAKNATSFLHYCKRLIEWIGALILVLLLSPLILLLILLQLRSHPIESIVEAQWCVGERGKLFRVLKFRTTAEDKKGKTFLGSWMRKYGLDNLPLLFNVLRGEMSLIGPRCTSLQEAVKLTSDELYKLNFLPGVIGSWQVDMQLKLIHLDSQTL